MISRLSILLMTLLAFLIGLSTDAQAFSVDQVRFGAHSEKTRMVLDLSENKDFRVFALDSPYRLVIDLPSFDWKAGSVERPKNSNILAVRHGNLKPGISRLVFDLNQPIALQAAFLLPHQKSAGKPDRLVIDFAPTSASAFLKNKNKILGTLSVDDSKAGKVRVNPAANNNAATTAPQRNIKPMIVIDPGHGGYDPGHFSDNHFLHQLFHHSQSVDVPVWPAFLRQV